MCSLASQKSSAAYSAGMRSVVDREFSTPAPCEAVWKHLANVANWPSWARHIKSVDVVPPGALQADTVGTFRLKGAPSARFEMRVFEPPRRWSWFGKFLWLGVDYDHLFESREDGGTDIRFLVAVRGFGNGTLGRLFGRVYGGKLDKAIPHLLEELVLLTDSPSRET